MFKSTVSFFENGRFIIIFGVEGGRGVGHETRTIPKLVPPLRKTKQDNRFLFPCTGVNAASVLLTKVYLTMNSTFCDMRMTMAMNDE